ncbi:hypothetical protein ACIQWN_36785 [Streptomyces vinaceus]|uniref:hypothetical protein n=1 Tax=Streptomyces vinaceus TaxID=1960 RepID=UPI00381408DE
MAGSSMPGDDQNLWRSVFTTAGGWSADVAFADHLSAGAPALARVDDVVVCVHRGAREQGKQVLPMRWTWHRPGAMKPLLEKVDTLSRPLPEGASDAEAAARQSELAAAVDAVDAARRWAPDTDLVVHGDTTVHAWGTPALAVLDGFVYCVYAKVERQWSTTYPQLELLALGRSETGGPGNLGTEHAADQGAVWQPVHAELPENAVSPALAVHEGKLHLVWVDYEEGTIGHRVLHVRPRRGENAEPDPELRWPEVVLRGEGEGPWVGRPMPDPEGRLPVFGSADWETKGYTSGLGLVSHNGKLHLIFRRTIDLGTLAVGDPRLYHAVFDGTGWSTPLPPGAATDGTNEYVGRALDDAHRSRKGAVLASFDGKLHTVYPAADADVLRTATYDEATATWSAPRDLAGHTSRNAPALLPLTDGPAGAEVSALLMVHRGIDRYVPPPPPEPPKPPKPLKIAARHSTVYGGATDQGNGGWSRAAHGISATAFTLEDGSRGIHAHWGALFEYYWGRSYYPDTGTLHDAALRLHKVGGDPYEATTETLPPTEFDEYSPNLRGFWTKLPPGEYQVILSGRTRKSGGYWWRPLDGDNNDPEVQAQRDAYSGIDFHPLRITITVP